MQAILGFRDQHAAGSPRPAASDPTGAGTGSSSSRGVEETLAEFQSPGCSGRPGRSSTALIGLVQRLAAGPAGVSRQWAGDQTVSGRRRRADRARPADEMGFITRWWTDKAAQLNPDVEAARSVLEFEEYFLRPRPRRARADRRRANRPPTRAAASTATPRSAATARSTTSFHGPTAATTASTTSSPPATAATTANAPPSPAPSISPGSSGATKPGTRTSLRCRSSAAGHATPTARTGSPAPPICTPPASAPSGYAPEPE